MSQLTDLIAQTKLMNPQLGADLEREFKALSGRRHFGLNFERHRPESVELPQRPIRKGEKVRVLPKRGSTKRGDERLWRVNRVVRVDGQRVAELSLIGAAEPEVQSVLVDDLVVVAEFRDPIYPGLTSTGKIQLGDNQPFHTVINGENYHVLEVLTYTHKGKIDCIYIDPPYNTGQDEWIYNDRHVDANDMFRHSKWLAFMERRLLLALDLLAETGVIIVAIGDDEHHRLRMLMDQIFGEQNFISNVVWQGGRKNDSRYVSNGADYMLVYAKSEPALQARGIRWREEKPGVREALEVAKSIWEESGGDHARATRHWREWLKEFKRLGGASDAVTRFASLSYDGRPMRGDRDLRSPNPRPNLQYDLLHPVTKKPVKMHPNGWRYSQEVMLELVNQGRVKFGPDETAGAGGIDFLDEQVQQVASSFFERDRNPSGIRLKDLLGEKRFPNPKDHEVLMRWIGLVCGPNAIILDFFGGSGSTLEAVVRLNSQDGGSRQCILVTNNEVGAKEIRALRKAGLRDGDPEWEAKGVYQWVTRPRITTVVTGVRPDGSVYKDSVPANVEFFDLTYETPLHVAHNRAFTRIAPLLWMKAGSTGRRIDATCDAGWDVTESYGVLFDLDRASLFCEAVAKAERLAVAFIVTNDDRRYQSVTRNLPEGVEPVRLYESYMSNFRIHLGE
ncbi:site-specific DNA-methyltransferase [Micromonospora sp. AMSO12t]|nr:site-specific DNA-methyltransferase [Micromonospora sp. AMSO12t]